MWLAGAIPLSTIHSKSLLHFLLFWETHDLVWEIICVSEMRMKNSIVKIIDNVFEKNDEGGLFPLKGKKRSIITSDRPPSDWENALWVSI